MSSSGSRGIFALSDLVDGILRTIAVTNDTKELVVNVGLESGKEVLDDWRSDLWTVVWQPLGQIGLLCTVITLQDVRDENVVTSLSELISNEEDIVETVTVNISEDDNDLVRLCAGNIGGRAIDLLVFTGWFALYASLVSQAWWVSLLAHRGVGLTQVYSGNIP